MHAKYEQNVFFIKHMGNRSIPFNEVVHLSSQT